LKDEVKEMFGGRTAHIFGKIFLHAALVMLLVSGSAGWAEAGSQDNSTVVFTIGEKSYQKDGQLVVTDVAPYIKNGRIMVSAAFVAEALGVPRPEWDPIAKTIIIRRGSDVVVIKVGETMMTMNGRAIPMDAAAEIVQIDGGGRLMLPVASIARALQITYKWDATARSVTFYGSKQATTFSRSGLYGPVSGSQTVAGDVVVEADGVTLRNMHIQGNLTIAASVGDGNVTLQNIKVDGDTFIRGGGANSIRILGGQYNQVYVQTGENGAVRIVAVGIDGIEIVITEDASGQEIILEGSFAKVTIDAPNVTFSTQGEGVIGELLITERATNLTATIGGDYRILSATIDGKGSKWAGKPGAVRQIKGAYSGESDVVDPDKVILRGSLRKPSRDRRVEPPAPAILSAVISSVFDEDEEAWLHTLTITFDMDTNTPAALTAGNIDALINFHGKLLDADGLYNGVWTTDAILTITVDNPIGLDDGGFDGGDQLTIRAAGNLRNAAGTSPPSTATANATGFWSGF
jgi:hypothetical protein